MKAYLLAPIVAIGFVWHLIASAFLAGRELCRQWMEENE